MPDPDAAREDACSRGYDGCVDEPRWLTTEGRREICQQLFDAAAPCGTLQENRDCQEQLVEHEATLHETLSCEWPQPVPLPRGPSYGC